MPSSADLKSEDALMEIKKICQRTVDDLHIILCDIEHFLFELQPEDQNKSKNIYYLKVIYITENRAKYNLNCAFFFKTSAYIIMHKICMTSDCKSRKKVLFILTCRYP